MVAQSDKLAGYFLSAIRGKAPAVLSDGNRKSVLRLVGQKSFRQVRLPKPRTELGPHSLSHHLFLRIGVRESTVDTALAVVHRRNHVAVPMR